MRHRTLTALCAALALAACGSDSGATSTAPTAVPIGSLPGSVPAASSELPTTTTLVNQASTTSLSPAALAAECLSTWPLQDRIALLVWPSVYAADWAEARQVVADYGVGGVILMKPDDAFAAELATHLTELDDASPHGVLVATDEEGGQVQRLAALGTLPSQQATSAMDPTDVEQDVADHAAVIAAAGVDVVLGPVVDVRPADGSSDPLGQGRLFEGDAQAVADQAAVYVRAWQRAGLLPTLKHFPGHGSATLDTHDGLAQTPPLDELRGWDFVPYRQLAASGSAVMVGHLDVPGLTDGGPASRSAAAVALLRKELGWGDALVMTDALGMGGVGMPVPDAAVAALLAGVDVVIFTDTGQTAAVIDAIGAAVLAGRLSEAEILDSAVRVERELAARGHPCVPMG
ncbi:MAG: hypothetical protein M9961_13985 [Ilumatobacteraceae bacterium]|nr:hypothetical protein [Ilumatobacter sp.]MCO5331181.1 hypothetical protein [Ilumatobacteraceae bacterium]